MLPGCQINFDKKSRTRQQALKDGDTRSFEFYRILVNVLQKKCRCSYCNNKMENLKHMKPKDWRNEIKKINGIVFFIRPKFFFTLQVDKLEDLAIKN